MSERPWSYISSAGCAVGYYAANRPFLGTRGPTDGAERVTTIMRLSRAVLAALCITLFVSACSLFHHESDSRAAASSSTTDQDECARLRTEIRAEQQRERQAPTTSTDENIVNAAQAKADHRLDDLQSQYDAQNCSSETRPPARAKNPPLPAAPGGPLQ